ncbi:MAG TPA: hypothetical protein VG204_04425 [Terriglobia bacterium]|nr:hypothetical protein [Terriglobia bacterium]
MTDSQNGLLDTAVSNFFHASMSTGSSGDVLGLVFVGLMQVANAVANQVSDSDAQGLAQVASTNLNNAGFAVRDNVTRDDLQSLALGLQQLTAAMKALN